MAAGDPTSRIDSAMSELSRRHRAFSKTDFASFFPEVPSASAGVRSTAACCQGWDVVGEGVIMCRSLQSTINQVKIRVSKIDQLLFL